MTPGFLQVRSGEDVVDDQDDELVQDAEEALWGI